MTRTAEKSAYKSVTFIIDDGNNDISYAGKREREREKAFKRMGSGTFLSDNRSVGGAFFLLTTGFFECPALAFS